MEIEKLQQSGIDSFTQDPGLKKQIEGQGKQEQPTGQEREQISRKELDQIATGLENYLSSTGRKLSFHIHEESDQLQVNVIDQDTDKVIKQIPPDEILELAASIEKTVGIFLDKIL